MPTRNGRNGTLFTREGQMNMRNEKWKNDFSPIEAGGASFVDEMFSRAYLRHLVVAGEMLGAQIASLHNVAFYLWLVGEARAQIKAGTFAAWKKDMVERTSQKI
jgi:queuine tRNA-ribosyltransferase